MGKTIAAEMNKLRNIQMALEKHEESFLSILKQEMNDVIFLHKLEEERNLEINYIKDHVVNTFNLLNSIKDKIVNYKTSDLKILRRDMEDIEQNIKTFKAELKKQLTSLQEKEINLCESVKICNDQITEWSKPLNISFNIESNTAVVNKIDRKSKKILFADELCGWSTEEHNVFLKMKKKHTGIGELAKILNRTLFDKSEEDVLKHDANYTKHLDFKRKQKEEIDRWREERRRSRAASGDKITAVPKKSDVISPEDNKDRLLAWKEKKKLKSIVEKQSELEQECKKKIYEASRRMKSEITKKEVEIWKLEKLADDLVEQEKRKRTEEKEKEFRTHRANQLIKEYQHQDEVFIKKMRENKKTKSIDIKALKCRVVAQKDPSRLLKPTKQWLARINDNNKFEMCVQDIKIVPKLGIPQWRKEAI